MTARRGSILLVVFGVIVFAALAAAAVLRHSTAASWSMSSADRRLVSRLAAWSGVEGVMAELASQRPSLLAGGSPKLTDHVIVQSRETGDVIARIIPIEGQTAVSECGRLDLNRAPVEWLTRLPEMDPAMVSDIDAARCAIPCGSLEELTRLGVPPASITWPMTDISDGAPTQALRHWLSAFPVDTDDSALDPSGPAPICLCEELTERDCLTINEIAGIDLCAVLKTRTEAGQAFASASDFARLAAASGVEPRRIGELLDRVRLKREPIITGRVDLNSAPAAVLACLPGMDRATADRIVEARERIAETDRANLMWPVFATGVEMEKVLPLVDHIGVRSLVWRVRVEAGVETGDSEGTAGRSEGEPPALSGRTVLEAVIDLSTKRPRVVYLRDITHLAIAARLDDMLPASPPEDDESETISIPSDASPPPLDPGQEPQAPRTGRVSRWSVPK